MCPYSIKIMGTFFEYGYIQSRLWVHPKAQYGYIRTNVPILNQEYGTFEREYGYHRIGYGHILLNMGTFFKK